MRTQNVVKNSKTWAVSKRAELNRKLDELLTGQMKDEQALRALVAHYNLVGVYNYSLFNTFLIKAQGGTIAQSFTRWKKLNRHVKKGEKARIYVYVPFTVKVQEKSVNENGEEIITETEEIRFFLKPVFDISQTEGEPLKFEHNSRHKIEGLSYEELRNRIARATGLEIYESEEPENARGYLTYGKIVINIFSNETDRIKTLIHELSHFLLDHLEDERDRAVKEIEAEATTFIVLEVLKIDNTLSKAYVEPWKNPEVIKQVRKGKILKTSDKILNMLNCK